MTRVVGLTGGVASGKSHVLRLFAELGVPHLEADDVGRIVVQAGQPALAEIVRRFGDGVLQADGQLDRQKMRGIVFRDAAALADLNAITHPHIRRHIREWLAAQTTPYCLLSAAILLESSLSTLVDHILVVDAPEADQLRRLIARDGISPELAQAMLSRQASRAERLAAAHTVIDNGDPPADLHPQVLALHRRWSESSPPENR